MSRLRYASPLPVAGRRKGRDAGIDWSVSNRTGGIDEGDISAESGKERIGSEKWSWKGV